jgi:hypothetical protein
MLPKEVRAIMREAKERGAGPSPIWRYLKEIGHQVTYRSVSNHMREHE